MRYACPAVLLLLLALLAAAMAAGMTMPFDLAARAAIHGLASDRLTALARLLSLIGSNPVWIGITVVAMLALWARARVRQAVVLAVAMSGAAVLDNISKVAFHRTRPAAFFGTVPASYSFPSGHALFAACFYGMMAVIVTSSIGSRAARAVVWAVSLLAALGIGLSRIYLGVHYPSDVLAGWLLGFTWLAFLWAAGVLLQPAERRSGPHC